MSFVLLPRIALSAAEQRLIPDSLVRMGIRRLLIQRLREMRFDTPKDAEDNLRKFLDQCALSRIAEMPQKANEQHYEVSARFFQQVLGPHLKYSCCHWGDSVSTLQQAEEEALSITCERAALEDGMSILELGCGWGSLSLWMADNFPNSQIVAVSNSHPQRNFIESEAEKRGIENLTVRTADISEFSTSQVFDRVVSVEMFEHVRNHAELMRRIATWLKRDGKLFVHIFAHRSQPYFFEDKGEQDWMTRHFFTGGMMPSEDLLLNYQESLRLTDRWRWVGKHYQRTCNAWLQLAGERRADILPCLQETYGEKNASIWLQRWRMFFMACAELFGYHDGDEWGVCHYLFEKLE
ncbi:Cyclopropane-fatty-acyl-phospholipid synthase [Thalassoglobus neptunius]|uniref:Cyclopropane-fatty-acyl-phospholipid synthase n=1 Tax=Thalassoglobus neptunius TaxID=1938619 RepID=A0A5C5W8C9_9PLAN|nr:cyclopropane-fatty-acyl-phospholipid synthase family protein [Thalassoglobus neptunius]TWT47148.1 Cyclopropane-fatty-acyl-phospholipid synthase [Thalassoglobus neptunius]